MCMYVCVYVCMCIYIYVHRCVCVFVCLCVCVCLLHMYVAMHVHAHVYEYVIMYICMHGWMCLLACIPEVLLRQDLARRGLKGKCLTVTTVASVWELFRLETQSLRVVACICAC